MTFQWENFLYLLFLLPIFIGLDIKFQKDRETGLVPFGNLEVLTDAIQEFNRLDLFKHTPLLLKSLIFIFLVIGIARPSVVTYKAIKDTKIMLLIDNSISMEATDIEPNRLTAAKEAAKKFITELPKGIQSGTGFFSGNVQIIVNPTRNKKLVLTSLDELTIDNLEPGTAIGEAINAGSKALTISDKSTGATKNRILVLITDGEANTGDDPLLSAAKAKVNNITVYTIGIGNPDGTIIRGNILTSLDELTLKEIASLTKGHYFNAKNLSDLNKTYNKIKDTIKLTPASEEITYIPLSTSLLLLLILQILRWSKFRYC